MGSAWRIFSLPSLTDQILAQAQRISKSPKKRRFVKA